MQQLLEMSRYLAIRSMLTRGAQRAVILASRIQDIEHETGDVDHDLFLEAREMVIHEAVVLPLGSFLQTSTSGALSKLIAFRGVELPPESSGNPVDALLIRPGEYFTSVDGKTFVHPSICPETGPCPNSATRRDPNIALELYMEKERHPLMVVMRAEVEPILPFLGKFYPEGTAYGYREEFRKGSYPVSGGSQQEIPTPSPPSETPVPTPTGEPTPTPWPCECTPEQELLCQGAPYYTCTVCYQGENSCECTEDHTDCQHGDG